MTLDPKALECAVKCFMDDERGKADFIYKTSGELVSVHGPGVSEQMVEDAITTYLTHLTDQVLVPLHDPTDEMISATEPLWKVDMRTGEPLYGNKHGMINLYRTMIAARPQGER